MTIQVETCVYLPTSEVQFNFHVLNFKDTTKWERKTVRDFSMAIWLCYVMFPSTEITIKSVWINNFMINETRDKNTLHLDPKFASLCKLHVESCLQFHMHFTHIVCTSKRSFYACVGVKRLNSFEEYIRRIIKSCESLLRFDSTKNVLPVQICNVWTFWHKLIDFSFKLSIVFAIDPSMGSKEVSQLNSLKCFWIRNFNSGSQFEWLLLEI